MASVKEIIDINITRETGGVTRQGFGTPLFLAEITDFAERVRTYTDIAGVTEDFGTNSSVYTAAVQFFSQQTSPQYIKIGRKNVDSIDGSVATVSDNSVYQFTVNGTEVKYTSGTGATSTSIVTGLAGAATSLPSATFTDNLDGTFTIVPDADAASFVVNHATSNLKMTPVSTELWEEAVDAVTAADDDYYFLTTETHEAAHIESIATYIEAHSKLYFASYSGDDALDSEDTTDIGSVLNAKGINRTVLLFSRSADAEFPECAFVGLQAPKDPGTSTWKFKTLAGVTVDKLTTTQSLLLRGTQTTSGKGYNTYESVGGRSITREGKVAGGEFIDVMRTVDWTEARMRERIYLTLVNSDKIPYTSAGFAIIEGRMREVLQEGVNVGAYASYTIEVPDPLSIDPNLRAARVADGFKFQARLASAIHFVGVNGRVTI